MLPCTVAWHIVHNTYGRKEGRREEVMEGRKGRKKAEKGEEWEEKTSIVSHRYTELSLIAYI